MKLALVVLLVAFTACQAASPEPYGVIGDVIDDIKDFAKEVLNKIQEMIDDITKLIEETKQWYDDLKAKTHPQHPVEYYLEKLYNKIIGEIKEIVLRVVDFILDVYEKIVTKIDDFFNGLLGENTIGQAIYEFMDELLGEFMEQLIAAVRKALEFLTWLDEYDWAEFIDKVVAEVKEAIDTKVDEFRKRIKEKLKPSTPVPATYDGTPDIPNSDITNSIGDITNTIEDFFQQIINNQADVDIKQGMVNVNIVNINNIVNANGFIANIGAIVQQLLQAVIEQLQQEEGAEVAL